MKLMLLGLAATAAAYDHSPYNVFGARENVSAAQWRHGGLDLASEDRGQPQQVHIALAGRDADGWPNGFAVSWYTEGGVDCHVEYGPTGGARVNKTAVAARKQYMACSGYHHHATMGPLVEGQTYDYQVVCPATQPGLLAASLTQSLYSCNAGYEKSGLICYEACRAGYTGVGPMCWENCQSGFHDDGATCRIPLKIIASNHSACPWYDVCGLTLKKGCSSCPDGYVNDGCTCRVPLKVVGKQSYGRKSEALTCDPNSPTPEGASAVLAARFAVKMGTRPLTMSVYGDMGYLGSKERPMDIKKIDSLSSNWSAVPTREILEGFLDTKKIDAVWHVGDIGYADDSFAHNIIGGNYEKAYNGYMNWMQNITAAVPYMVSVGNHESECHSPTCVVAFWLGYKLANFTAYNSRWHMPAEESGGVQNMWYSYNYGPAHIVSVNTETDFPGAGEEKKGDSGIFPAGKFAPDGAYLKWLEADLAKAAADRAAGKISFIIAGGHRPVDDDLKGVQELFIKYKVDLYLAGHSHSYSRSFKSCGGSACRGTLKNDTTTYVVAGGAGCDEMDFGHIGPSAGNPKTPFFTAEMGSGTLTFHNATTLEWRLVSSLNATRIVDQFFLDRQHV
eukprot:TRINITY_DN6801_c0_g1_i4.p1 TRINITY_DN6801_c0_g1~~TRINITY_DN6801_c0_g1_i4.p1  ORF type:complete len:618 (+),score=245.38 TRINITY_DN6801_c0_g1_i4:49-1902(+)